MKKHLGIAIGSLILMIATACLLFPVSVVAQPPRKMAQPPPIMPHQSGTPAPLAWEYRIVPVIADVARQQERINSVGNEGWELVAVYVESETVAVYYFKRQKAR